MLWQSVMPKLLRNEQSVATNSVMSPQDLEIRIFVYAYRDFGNLEGAVEIAEVYEMLCLKLEDERNLFIAYERKGVIYLAFYKRKPKLSHTFGLKY